ncbi:MAG: hypothetical protein E6R07_01520 [Nevskiaceae bacterium]|nr:MAG: hypothetical protein E6R07_01520 [Nevskiaceae bacterium]
MNAAADQRICFVGDSFVAGVGDPEHLGWVGRVCARAAADGHALTAYNLGVRRETSADISGRWQAECARRLPPGCSARVVFSFGVNDMVMEAGRERVAPPDSAANLQRLLEAARRHYDVAMIGPPPVADEALDQRVAALTQRYSDLCAQLSLPYLPMHAALHASDAWMHEVRLGDGAHPRAAGYAAFAARVADWKDWWFHRSAA